MRLRLLLAVLAAVFLIPPAARAQDVGAGAVGAWSAQEDYCRAVIVIERDGDGSLRGFFAGADRVPGAPLSRGEARGDSVFFEAADVGARFRGAFSADGPTIRGTYS